MSYTLEVLKPALKQLEKFDPKLRTRVDAALLALEAEPRPPGCLKLHEPLEGYRIRVSDVRILYRISDKQRLIEVHEIRWRDKAYPRKKR